MNRFVDALGRLVSEHALRERARALPVRVSGVPSIGAAAKGGTDTSHVSRWEIAEGRVEEAWQRLHEAEVRGALRRELEHLEVVFREEVATLGAVHQTIDGRCGSQ